MGCRHGGINTSGLTLFRGATVPSLLSFVKTIRFVFQSVRVSPCIETPTRSYHGTSQMVGCEDREVSSDIPTPCRYFYLLQPSIQSPRNGCCNGHTHPLSVVCLHSLELSDEVFQSGRGMSQMAAVLSRN